MRSIIFAAITLVAAMAHADNIKTISGEATYHGESFDTQHSCRAKALERARVNALAKEFGTLVANVTESRETDDASFFSSLSTSEVRGEWIADVGEPQYDVKLDAQGNMVVTCRVKGQARALSNKAADFEAQVLRNGTDPRNAATDFKPGDDLFVSFRAPTDGYLAIYLVMPDGNVATLLPYLSSASGRVAVRHGKDYLFFNAQHADRDMGTPDELTITTEDAVEHDRLYILFSPNEFTKAADRDGGENMPRNLSYEDFTKWLSKVRRADDRMGMKVFNVVITNTNFQ